MRNLKKFLALVLAMMMALSLMVTANAANEADNGSNKYPDGGNITPEFVEAVDVLNGMGIMTGDYGNFYADRGVMRSEMAAVLYRLMTGDTGNYKNELYANLAAERFYDVKATDWFASYVGWCYDAGIMVGSGGYFRPTANVTGYETEVMVLRAMGYGKNHEYTGAQWKINASYDATVNGLLRDVVNTNYSTTLSANTRRDVVASIVFQAAQLPTVTWTPSLGYNKYIGVATAVGGNLYNPSLGETHFGLTCATGVVVGNQATGEGSTMIGFTSAPARGTVNNIMVNGSPSGSPNQYRVGPSAYIYASNAAYDANLAIWGGPAAGAADVKNFRNQTRSFAWETDLSLFNHAVKVWFNWNSTKTYALYDEATATAIVTSDETTAGEVTVTGAYGAGNANLASLANGIAGAANNWDTTRMSAPRSNAFFNYSFAAMTAENYAANADAAATNAVSGHTNAISAVSPIHDNDENTASQHGLYLLISNSADKGVDVVISLDMTMTKVVQSNTTTAPLSVGVLAANDAGATTVGGNAYFDYWVGGNDYGKLAGVGNTGADTSYVSLLKGNLKNTTEDAQKLNTKVAAISITGTNGGVNTAAAPGVAAFGKASVAGTTFTSQYYYQLTQPTHTLTGKVIKVDTVNQDVYLEGGKVLHQSVFAEDTDATFTTDIEGWDNANFRLVAGRDYTFTLDAEDGNYIYWETPAVSSNFVYGTYIDWETKTASSEFRYPLVYVDTNGKQQVSDISSVDGAAMGTGLYDLIKLPKRDSTSINSSGYIKGIYKGYALSSTGALTTVTDADSKGTGFLQGAAGYFGAAIDIGSQAVTLGAKEVAGGSNMFLTENTQFYIVDGAGTENQTVTPYKGISELMKDMSSVVIHGEYTSATPNVNWGSYLNPAELTTAAYEMFYYQAGRFDYDQNYNASALEIKTIYLPKQCVEFNRSTTTSLVFVGNSAATLFNSNNGEWATQFTVYNTKGEASNVWIDGRYDQNAAPFDAYNVITNGNDVFYELRDSGKKATDGNPIYKIAGVSNPGTTVIGRYWDGTALQTVNIGTNDLYKATTFNQQAAYINNTLYSVGAAGIKNLNTTTYPGIVDNNLSTLNGAGSLATNDGVPVSCILNADSNITVDFIFVNYSFKTP